RHIDFVEDRRVVGVYGFWVWVERLGRFAPFADGDQTAETGAEFVENDQRLGRRLAVFRQLVERHRRGQLVRRPQQARVRAVQGHRADHFSNSHQSGIPITLQRTGVVSLFNNSRVPRPSLVKITFSPRPAPSRSTASTGSPSGDLPSAANNCTTSSFQPSSEGWKLLVVQL